MALRVIGAGLGRTGTFSLKLALEKLLDGPCYHMAEVFEHPEHVPMWHDAALAKPVDWEKLFEGYVAAVDWPVGSYWKEVSAVYPDALILLSTRDAEKWWSSASETIFQSIPHIGDPAWLDMVTAMMSNRFTGDLQDKEACIAAYHRHNEDARKTAPARFLEWQANDGWEPICKALGLPIPEEPFPHANTKEEFQARIKARAEEAAAKT
jgi:hypothetical protein